MPAAQGWPGDQIIGPGIARRSTGSSRSGGPPGGTASLLRPVFSWYRGTVTLSCFSDAREITIRSLEPTAFDGGAARPESVSYPYYWVAYGPNKGLQRFQFISPEEYEKFGPKKAWRHEFTRRWRAQNQEAYRQSNRERMRARRAIDRTIDRQVHLRRAYGISIKDYNAILASQGNRCAICRAEADETLTVDHCHVTGRVRGLLCSPCNRALGFFEDSPERLRRAAEYLESKGACSVTEKTESFVSPCAIGRSNPGPLACEASALPLS
jgi:hypothetical protein